MAEQSVSLPEVPLKECWRCKKTLPRLAFKKSYSICRKCQDSLLEAWFERNPPWQEGVKLRQAVYYLRLRLSLIHRYGGKCLCCGENREEFLAIDHIDGDGNVHRRSIIAKEKGNTSASFYRWLIKNEDLTKFRTLCHNCNMARGLYGRCPHNFSGSDQVKEAAKKTMHIVAEMEEQLVKIAEERSARRAEKQSRRAEEKARRAEEKAKRKEEKTKRAEQRLVAKAENKVIVREGRKVCLSCLTEKEASEFWIWSQKRDSLRPKCKICDMKANQEFKRRRAQLRSNAETSPEDAQARAG